MDTPTPAHVKAHATGRWAETIFRALSTRIAKRWQFVSFRGKKKGDSRGVVDVVAIRRCMSAPSKRILKSGDLFDIVLVQIKGGSARDPTESDLVRLREVAKRYHAHSVVKFHWRNGRDSRFSVLGRDGKWRPCEGTEIFG